MFTNESTLLEQMSESPLPFPSLDVPPWLIPRLPVSGILVNESLQGTLTFKGIMLYGFW